MAKVPPKTNALRQKASLSGLAWRRVERSKRSRLWGAKTDCTLEAGIGGVSESGKVSCILALKPSNDKPKFRKLACPLQPSYSVGLLPRRQPQAHIRNSPDGRLKSGSVG